jgi:hypothetical protein
VLAARAAAAPAPAPAPAPPAAPTRASAAPYDDIAPDDDSWTPDADPGGEPRTPTTTDPDHPPGVTARIGPDVRDVIAAAIRAAGLAGDPASGWRTRARLSALVPQIGARIGQDETWRDVADPTLSHVVMFDIRASWRLDALVFSPSELRIASVDVLRRRERRRLAWYVISLYRAWRRTGNDDLAAQLDVVTDGWFSEHLANPPESHQ